MPKRPTKPSPEKLRPGTTRQSAKMRRRKFAAEYLSDPKGNATQAAIRAGYAPAWARKTAHLLLQHEDVQKWIEAGQAAVMRKLEITRDSVIEEIARIGFSNPFDFGRVEDGMFIIDLADTTREQAAAIKKFTTSGVGKDRKTSLELADKLPALEKLGRHLGLFRDDGGSELTVIFNIHGRESKEPPIEHARVSFTTDRPA